MKINRRMVVWGAIILVAVVLVFLVLSLFRKKPAAATPAQVTAASTSPQTAASTDPNFQALALAALQNQPSTVTSSATTNTTGGPRPGGWPGPTPKPIVYPPSMWDRFLAFVKGNNAQQIYQQASPQQQAYAYMLFNQDPSGNSLTRWYQSGAQVPTGFGTGTPAPVRQPPWWYGQSGGPPAVQGPPTQLPTNPTVGQHIVRIA